MTAPAIRVPYITAYSYPCAAWPEVETTALGRSELPGSLT